MSDYILDVGTWMYVETSKLLLSHADNMSQYLDVGRMSKLYNLSKAFAL